MTAEINVFSVFDEPL